MRWIVLAFSVSILFGQGTDPKPKAAGYDVHGRSGKIETGAEFMVHSFSGDGQMYIAEDYLVVEVALYPPKGETFRIDRGMFAIRVNGKKPALAAVTPQMVAATLQRPEWQGGGARGEAEGSYNGRGVILGRPVPSQVPGGQPRPQQAPLPAGGIDRPTAIPAHELVVRTALPEGEAKGPVAGFIYFPYRGKVSSIKSLDLVYNDVVLKLR
jgi:hypothetical protein